MLGMPERNPTISRQERALKNSALDPREMAGEAGREPAPLLPEAIIRPSSGDGLRTLCEQILRTSRRQSQWIGSSG
jgi:hypothetical protein